MIAHILFVIWGAIFGCPQEIGEDVKVLRALEEIEKFRKSGDVAGALKKSKEALKTFAESVALHRAFQNLTIAVGKKDAVVAEYRKRQEDRPSEAAAHYLLARLLDGEERIKGFRRALELDARFTWARLGLANHLRDERRFKEAAVEYEILQKDPTTDRLEIVESLALCYYFSDRFDDEEKLLIHARKEHPDSPLPSVMLGTLYRATGRTAQAIEELEGVIKRDKTVFKAYEPLIQAFYQAGDERKGRAMRDSVKEIYREGVWKREDLPAYLTAAIVFLERHALTVKEALTADGVDDPVVAIQIRSTKGNEKDSSILLKRKGGKYILVRQWETGRDGRVYHTYEDVPALEEVIKTVEEIIAVGK